MAAQNFKRQLKTWIPRNIKFYVKKTYLFKVKKNSGYSINYLSSSPDLQKFLIKFTTRQKNSLLKAEVDRSALYNYRIKSPKLKLLYFEVPKNASSTIKTVLFSVEHKNKYDPEYSMFMDFRKWQAEFYNMSVNWNEIAELPYIKFAFLRNPYERLLSGYLNTGWHFYHQNTSFEKFIESIPERVQSPATDILNNHYKPFSYFIPKIKNNFFIDFIGKVESFSSDFKLLLNSCNIDIDLKYIIPANKSQSINYKNYHTTRTRKIIEDIYGEEIELGKYTF